jgi:transporter family protein
MKPWFVPAFLALMMWGVWGFLPKLSTRIMSPISVLVFQGLGVFLVAAAVLFFVGSNLETVPKGILLAVATGVFGMLGALFYLMAIKQGKVSTIVTLTALYPLISIALAWMVLKEPITLKEGMGMVLAVIAIVLLAT